MNRERPEVFLSLSALKKYSILLAAFICATVYIRYQTNEVAKEMYNEGCSDAALKLQRLGKSDESEQITKFCVARKTMLDEFMRAFEQ